MKRSTYNLPTLQREAAELEEQARQCEVLAAMNNERRLMVMRLPKQQREAEALEPQVSEVARLTAANAGLQQQVEGLPSLKVGDGWWDHVPPMPCMHSSG
jgi:hypothetical protein